MDILIKSFNRAYYLDRCLHSIFLYLEAFEGRIYILDDGTPSLYLEEIKTKYPSVILLKSEYYEEKSTCLSKGDYNLPEVIPSKLWYESTLKLSDYFIVLEDDMWFTRPINIKDLEAQCYKENITLLKLFWVSNPKVIGKTVTKNVGDIVVYAPDIPFKSVFLFKYIYTKYHKLWRKLMTVLGVYTLEKELGYYTMYSVAGAIFKKDYYSEIWKNAHDVVDEKQQMGNALTYYNANATVFGRTPQEVLKTGFISSAFPKYTCDEFSIHDFNAALNVYWLNNPTPFLKDLGADVSITVVNAILEKMNKSKTYIREWNAWVERFKNEFRTIGCNI